MLLHFTRGLGSFSTLIAMEPLPWTCTRHDLTCLCLFQRGKNLLQLLNNLWKRLVLFVLSVEFQRLLKSSSKIIRDLIKLQSVPAVVKFYLSGTGTNMSSHVKGKSMGKGSIAISVEKLPRPLMEWSSTWSELICCMPENSVGSSLLVLTQNFWWCWGNKPNSVQT